MDKPLTLSWGMPVLFADYIQDRVLHMNQNVLQASHIAETVKAQGQFFVFAK